MSTDTTHSFFLSEEDKSLAQTAVRAVERSSSALRLESEGEIYSMPRDAAKQIVRMLNMMAEGEPVKVVPDLNEITVEQAACILDISVDRMNRLLNENLIPSRKEGDIRRIVLESVLEYDRKKKYRHALLEQLTQEAQDMGLYD